MNLELEFFSSEIPGNLARKTQVIATEGFDLDDDRFETRLTHSLKVGSATKKVVQNIFMRQGKNVDEEGNAFLVGMEHDIGHTAGGHETGGCLDKALKQRGFSVGFDDNASVLTVLERAGLLQKMSPAAIAGIVKYPDKLYPEHQYISSVIRSAIQKDSDLVGVPLKRTILCDIMDRVDEVIYTFSDLADAMVLKFVDQSHFENIAHMYGDSKAAKIIALVKAASAESSKTTCRALMAEAQDMMVDELMLSQSGNIEFSAKSLKTLRESLFKIEREHFIHSEKLQKDRLLFLSRFNRYVERILDENFTPSKKYAELIEDAIASQNTYEVMRLKRNMIQEASESFIYKEGV